MSNESEVIGLRAELERQQLEVRQQFPEVAKASESIVKVVPHKYQRPFGQGSCVAIEGGYLLTAFHVVEQASMLALYTTTEEKFCTIFEGNVTVDPSLDIAVFSLPEVFEPLVPQVKLGKLDLNETLVFLVGLPKVDTNMDWPLYGQQAMILPARVKLRDKNELTMLGDGTIIKIMKGMSGGAVLNREGEVVGLEKASIHNSINKVNIVGATTIESVYNSLFC